MNYTEQYIKVLKKVNESSRTFNIIATNKSYSDSDKQLLKELINDGYANGNYQRASKQIQFLDVSSTVKGRIFQDELEQKQKDKTITGRILKHVPSYIAFILGILTNFITFFFLMKK